MSENAPDQPTGSITDAAPDDVIAAEIEALQTKAANA